MTVLHIIPQWAKIGTKDSPSHEQTDKLTSCNFLGCNHDTTLTTQTPSHQQKILVEKKRNKKQGQDTMVPPLPWSAVINKPCI